MKRNHGILSLKKEASIAELVTCRKICQAQCLKQARRGQGLSIPSCSSFRDLSDSVLPAKDWRKDKSTGNSKRDKQENL